MIITPTQQSRLAYGQTELIHTIRRCGLTSGLKLCLDAGDANSYSGSGQSWLDTSGNGYDFFRGADGSAAADDPTYNGTAGQRASTNYWSFDGGDYFRYDSANEAWMNNLHKDNAKFTLAGWVYHVTGSQYAFAGTNTDSSYSNIGFSFTTNSSALNTQFGILNGGGTGRGAGLFVSGNALAANAWNLCAVSLDEAIGADGGFMYLNGTSSLFNSAYTSPSAGSATATFEIGAVGNAIQKANNTSRLGMFAAWEGVALTQTQLNAVYQTTRGRYGV